MEPLRFRRGFTLVELMVVLAIMLVVTSVVLTSQSTFNKTLTLANTAYDIALLLRSAEAYGLGSRASGGAANVGYGVDFQKSTPGSFTFFADTYPSPQAANCHGVPQGGVTAPDANPGNCAYDAGSDGKVNTYTLGNGLFISDFCAFYASGPASCAGSNGISSLAIVFTRPNPDPFMSVDGSYAAPPFSVTGACLAVSSPQGGARFISVAASGEITANAASCP